MATSDMTPRELGTADRSRKIAETAWEHGEAEAAQMLGITVATVKRSIRRTKKVDADPEPLISESRAKRQALLGRIGEKFTDKELSLLARGSTPPVNHVTPIHDFTGEIVRIGVLTDTHLGSKYTNPEYLLEAFDQFDEIGVDMVVHAGDVTEGLSHRPGHMYECTHVGYEAQKRHAIEALSQWDQSPFYMISGNHDRWYIKSAGAHIVKDICEAIPNAEFLGDDEGDIWLNDKTNVRLWHGEDGSSYAHSYRLQKVIESFTGGDKPSMLIAGHVHKALYAFDRHVHCISAGCIQRQSKWMRGKRLPSHTGFWIVEMVVNEKGISRVRPEFFPFYV